MKDSSCDARIQAYKNGKTMEQCKEVARKNTEILSNVLCCMIRKSVKNMIYV